MDPLDFPDPTDNSACYPDWLERLPAMVHSIDSCGRFVFVNQRWLAALGYRREDVIGRLAVDFMTAESRRRAEQETIPALFRDGHYNNVDCQLICQDGRLIDVVVSSVLVSKPGGPAHSLTVINDVTAQRIAERHVAESEQLYHRLVEEQSEFVSLATPEGVFLCANSAQSRLFGVSATALADRRILDLVPVEQHAKVIAVFAKVASSGVAQHSENQIRLPNGELRWVRWTNSATRASDNGPVLIHSVGHDIQAEVDAELKLHESETRYRLLADASEDMIMRLDKDLVRTYVSPASMNILGYAPEELVGQKTAGQSHPNDVDRLRAALNELLEGRVQRYSLVNRRRHRDGRWIWLETNFRALIDPETGRATDIIAIARDVSARKAVEEQLAEAYRRLEVIAGQDGLTGLANRRTFDETLLQEQKRSSRVRQGMALVMIDVDFFKAYNDRYGHPAGDECLKLVADAIRDAVSRPGDLAVRFGGEEFAVLAPSVDEEGAQAIGELIRKAVQALAVPHASSPFGVITVSVGVTSATSAAFVEDRSALLAQADRALYSAKAQGRNRVEASPTAPPLQMTGSC